MDINRLCMHCMRELPHPNAACPYCGYDIKRYPYRSRGGLEPGKIFKGHYLVGLERSKYSVPGQCICYIALDLNQKQRVLIREYQTPQGYRYQLEPYKGAATQRAQAAARRQDDWQHERSYSAESDFAREQNRSSSRAAYENSVRTDGYERSRTAGSDRSRSISVNKKKKKSNKGLVILLVILCLILASLIGAGIWYIANRDNGEKPEVVITEGDDPEDEEAPQSDPVFEEPGAVITEAPESDPAFEETEAKKETEAAPQTTPSGSGKAYTLMVYMVGSNLESQGGAASADIDEMLASGLDPDKTNLLIYTGGAVEWENPIISSQENGVFLLEGNKMKQVGVADGAENMGVPDTFRDFLDYCYDYYPAEHYGLICWDHGSGPVLGFGADENHDMDQLTLKEMSDALSASRFGSGARFDFVGFDACLMSSLEVAGVLDDYADYMIASQEVEGGFGWDYKFLKKMNSTTDPVEIGKEILSAFGDYNEAYNQNPDNILSNEYTLALIDLAGVSRVNQAMDTLFGAMNGQMSADTYSAFARARDNTKRYALVSSNLMELADLGDMAHELEALYSTEAASLSKEIADMVISQVTNVESSSGISMYYPYNDFTLYEEADGETVCQDFNESKEFCKFIRTFTDYRQHGVSAEDWTLGSFGSSGDQLTLALSSGQQADLSSAYLYILTETDTGYYTPVMSKCKVFPDKDGVIRIDKGQDIIKSGEMIWPMTQVEDRDESDVFISDQTNLYQEKSDIDLNICRNAIVSYRMNHDEVMLLNVEEGMSAEAMAASLLFGKMSSDLSDYQYVGYERYDYSISKNPDGNLLPCDEWERSGRATLCYTNIEALDDLSIENTAKDNTYRYFCQIVVEDTYGNRHGSELAEL